MKLIAIVGMAGSGKSELARLFVKEGYKKIRFGDITDQILKDNGLELTEENERKLRQNLREKHGMEAYAKLNLDRLKKALSEGKVVIDGLYSWEEYVFLKNEFGKMIFLLAIYTPPKKRYNRLVDREVRSLTIEQGKARDVKELQELNKAAPIAMADYTLLNVGTKYDLRDEFDKFILWLEDHWGG